MDDFSTEQTIFRKKIGDSLIPRLILGHLPFVGESYQGPQKNSEYSDRFRDSANTTKIMIKAIKNGIDVFASIWDQESLLEKSFSKAIEETEKLTNHRVSMIPCIQIPLTLDGRPIDVYRRWLTYFNLEKEYSEGVLRKYLEDPILNCRENWKDSFKDALKHSRAYEKCEIDRLKVDFEILNKSTSFPKNHNLLFIELGSETDFLAMTGRLDIIKKLIDFSKRQFKRDVLLGIHHAALSIPILDDSQIPFEGYLTPINKLGIMMFPSREKALEAIKKSKKPMIAIKPLAAGRINPKEALTYVFQDVGVEFCMIGVGSLEEAEEDFKESLRILNTP